MGGMAQADDWLRVWRVADPSEFIRVEEVRLTYDSQAGSTLGVEGLTAVYAVGELDAIGGPIRYVVQIRSADGASGRSATTASSARRRCPRGSSAAGRGAGP